MGFWYRKDVHCVFLFWLSCIFLLNAVRDVSLVDEVSVYELSLNIQMKEPRMLPPEEVSNIRMQKKKPSTQGTPVFQVQGEIKTVNPPSKKQKALKRNLKMEGSPSSQQPERSTSDSLPDSSRSGSEYRALRRRYLLLEEESFSLGRELSEVEAEVKSLEDEKFELLDQLVVLEGLLDPSELQPKG